MSRSSPVPLVLVLGALALAACAEDRNPTQPESGAEPASTAILAAALAPNTWTLKAAPPNETSFNGLSAGVMPDASGQSIVYTLGGRFSDQPESGCGSNILSYKIGTNTWTPKGYDPRLYVYNSNGVGRIGNTLYISGGESFCGEDGYHIDGRFSAYDPATNTVTAKPTPPKLTAGGVTGVIDGNLYVLPGRCSTDFYPADDPHYCLSQAIRTLFRYSPTTNRWTWKRQAPHNHANGAGGVINGKFYVAGGDGMATLDRYNPATDTWTTLAPLPKAGTAVGAVLQGKLYAVVQTGTSPTIVRRTYAYDPATNTWTSKAAPHWDHPAIVPITWGGKPYLLAVGGHHFDRGVQRFLPNPTEVYAP
jgi:N-acetylneuraminic acid mutarotase